MFYFKSKVLFLSILIGLLFGCTTTGGLKTSDISPAIVNAIALCNAGAESEIQGKLQAEILRNGGQITGSLRDHLQGIFVSNSNMSGEQALEAHRQYMMCLEKYLPNIEEEARKRRACEASLRCDKATMKRVRICRETVRETAEDMGLSKRQENYYHRKCYEEMSEGLHACWQAESSEELKRKRVECDAILSQYR